MPSFTLGIGNILRLAVMGEYRISMVFSHAYPVVTHWGYPLGNAPAVMPSKGAIGGNIARVALLDMVKQFHDKLTLPIILQPVVGEAVFLLGGVQLLLEGRSEAINKIVGGLAHSSIPAIALARFWISGPLWTSSTVSMAIQ